ncbi:MAG: peptidase [Candidatus Nealsonbacteria bacterium]|nr:peptidase [Candidatus Nealsonbacteria bacterium]
MRRCHGSVRPVLQAVVGMFLALAVAGLPGSPTLGAENNRPKKFDRGVLIRMEGPITPRLQQFLFRKLDVAKSKRADLVIIEIDSPGGYLHESLEIAERLRDLRDEEGMYAVAFVPEEAISGAAISALGCDEILMHPGALIGDAGAIYQGEDSLFRHAPQKIRDYLLEHLEGLAKAKGRPVGLIESMAHLELEVFVMHDPQSGETAYMSQEEIDADESGRWVKGKLVPETEKDSFLTVKGSRAVELKLAEGLVKTRGELRERFGLKDELLVLEPTGVDTAVYILNLWPVTGLLFVIGLVALYIEFSAPGIGLGGLVAGLCFSLFFWSRFLGGTAGWLEVVLFLAGVAFLAVELFVLPGFGIAGLSGLLLMFASIIMASQNFGIPNTARELQTTTHSLLVVLISGAVVGVAAYALTKHFGEIPILGRFMLQPPDAVALAADGSPMIEGTGLHGARFGVEIGDVGEADSPLRPAGKVRFGEEYVDVVTEGTLIAPGTQVRVIKISGNRVVVRQVE